MANASKFLEELEKQKKKSKDEGKDTTALEPIAPVKGDIFGSSPQVDSFFNALNMEREKLRQREEITEPFAPVKSTVGSVSGSKHGGSGGSFTVKSEEDEGLLDFFDTPEIWNSGDSVARKILNVGKSALGTVGDIGVGAVKGVMNMGEGIGDALQYGAASVADAFGGDEWADKVRKNAQRTAVDDAFAPVDDFLDKYSVLGRTLGSASEALGQIGGILATGGIAGALGAGAAGTTAATMGAMGLSSFGSSTGEAYKDGADEGEAELYGAIAGTADAVSELIFGGLGKAVKATGLSHGLSSADDILAKKLSEKITNTIAKNAVQFGVKASGEGAEEVLAGLAQAAGKKLTYMSEEEISDIIADENLLEQFVVGAMASGIAQAPNLTQSNKTGTDFITGRTKNEQAVIDRVVEQRIKDAETKADGNKLTLKERQTIEEEAAQDMERGRIDIDTIEEVLGGEEYKAYQDAVKEEDALRKEYQELGALKEPTLAEQTRYKELHEKASEFSSDERRTALKKKLSEHVAVVAQEDRLSESYAERARRKEYFTEDVSKYENEAAKKTVQNLIDSKVANNTGRTHDMVETVAKIAEDKGIVFNFTNNQKLRESGKMDAVAEGVTINGYKDADGITVNLDSPNMLKTVVGHEVTHVLEGTAEYTELATAAKEYAVTKGEYDSRRDAIASLYAEGTDVDSELTSDMVGEYLFTDEQFVSELSVKHQNVFQKVFDEIKPLYKMVTAGSKEARQLEQVERTFEKAYRAAQQETQAQAGFEYSLARVDGTDYVRAEKNLFVKEDGTLASEREVFKSLVGKKIQTADGEIEIVSRLPGKDMYNELSRRYPKSLGGVPDVKQVNSDVNYNMEELLETSEMKNANEPDKGGRHAAQGIVGFDTRTVKFYDGSRAYDVEFSIATLQDGRKVAYAKKFFGYDAELTKKIQTAESRSNQSPFDQQSVSDGTNNTADNSISQEGEKVNSQFSLSQDTQGRELTAEQREYFRDSKVKSVDNANPTSDPDIRRSLSDASHVSTKRGIYGRDIKYQGEEMQDAAPMQQTAETVPQMQQDAPIMADAEPAEDVAPMQETADQFVDADNIVQPEEQIAPMADDFPAGDHSELDRLHAEYDAARAEFDELSTQVQEMYSDPTPEEQEQAMDAVLAAGERMKTAQDALNAEQQSAIASYTDADVLPEMDAPYYGEQQEAAADEFADRDMKSVGSRSVKSYQYDNPEVKPFYQRTAREMQGDLSRTRRGARYMTEDGKWTGVTRITAYDIAALKDEYGVSYADISKALDAIIDDHGAENYALAKRVEILIHDRLSKGFVDAFSGAEIPPDQDYLALMEQKQSEDSGDEAFAELMADVPPMAEDMAPVAETAPAESAPAAGVSSAVETEVEEIDAPVADTNIDAAVREIQTTYDKILAKKQNAEAELAALKEQRAARSELYQTRIAELRRKLDGKKRKDTKVAVRLGQQITRLERHAADVDADYAKRISDAEKRFARRDFELKQDHTKADKLERAYAKIDAQLSEDRAAVETEFAQRRAELSASVADKNTFIGKRAKELYTELSHLKKGVRASHELGYLLDHGYDWRTLKSTLLKVNLQPDDVINPDSAEESVIREMLNEEYASRTFELGDLDNEMQDRLAELEADAEAQKAEVRKSEQQLYRKQLHANLVDGMKHDFAVRGYDLDLVLKDAKNLSTFATVDNTPQRVMERALGYKQGQILSDLTVNKTAQHETEGIRWLNQYTDPKNGLLAQISKTHHIKPGSKESAAAQMYAEGFYVNEHKEIIAYGDKELAADFPDVKTQAMIKGLAHDGRIRAIYDETLDAINESRVRNAYPEIPKRKDYFLHFRAMEDTFSTLGLPFNPNDIKAKDLPTDLNGVTADLKPGQPYFASAKQRKGKRTSFDLLGGLEKYLSSAKNQIYHIDDIQTLRALRNYIADDYGQAKGLDSLAGLSEEEVQERIEDVFGSHLSTFAKFLNEQANVLAGKTALIDRGLEGMVGRRAITFLNNLNRQVGANMVGYNVSSSLTNFIAPVQAFAKMNKGAFIKGFAQTVSNRIGGIFGRGDSFAQDSSVMVRREGEKRFHRTPWQKLSDPGYALMGAIDSISTEIIARGKYNELTGKGMSSEQAHYETDKWVSRLMGDRSLGQQPQLYNSKMLGLITKFQLEVRNQLDSQFYDTVKEAGVSTETIENVKKRNAVKAAKITSTIVQLAVAQHIFGKVFESIAGYNPAFDIIEAIIKAAGWDDDEDDDDTVLDNIEQGVLSLLEDFPYSSVLTGGRVPIESALPIAQFVKGKDSYGNDVSRWKTLAEAAPYYVLPGGYGQIKKTMQGLSMYSDEHPVAGSYTDTDKLRFPVGTAPADVAQAAVFGQYSSANARDYFDDERKPLSEGQIAEYAAADMTIQDYWRYRDGLAEHETLAEQAEYINSLDIPTWKKNLFINNLTDRKEDIDMTDFGQYGSLAEMDFAKKSPEKYALMQEQGVTYAQYQTFDDDTKNAYEWAAKSPEKYGFIRDIGYTLDDYAHATDTEKDAFTWAYNNPEKYLVSRAVSDDLFAYRGYTDAINGIEADKDAEGKSISGSRKDKVVEYINGLDLDYGAKIILLKQEYPAEDAYNYDIIDYLNERDDISGDDMVVMLTSLGFKVTDDGMVTWD